MQISLFENLLILIILVFTAKKRKEKKKKKKRNLQNTLRTSNTSVCVQHRVIKLVSKLIHCPPSSIQICMLVQMHIVNDTVLYLSIEMGNNN